MHLPSFINTAQATFVGSWSIGYNILLCQELFLNFHKDDKKRKQFALKVNLKKVYDMIDWNVILSILKTIGIPP